MEVHKVFAELGPGGKLRLEVPCGLLPGRIEVVVIMAQVPGPRKKIDFRDYEGLGKEIWEGVDAQEYVNCVRDGGDLEELFRRARERAKK